MAGFCVFHDDGLSAARISMTKVMFWSDNQRTLWDVIKVSLHTKVKSIQKFDDIQMSSWYGQ